MSKNAPYIYIPGFPSPILAQIKLLDDRLDTPYFGLRKVFDLYRVLKDALIKSKDDFIVDGQPSIRKKKSEFSGAKDKYKINKWPPDDSKNVDSSVIAYLKSLESELNQEKAHFSKMLSDFSDDLFGRNYSILVGAINYLPEKTILGYNLPPNKNAIFYDNVYKINGQFDLSNATKHPIDWPARNGKPTDDLITLLGETDYYLFSDRERVIKEHEGLALVCCRFGMFHNGVIDSMRPLSTKEKVGIITEMGTAEITP